MSQKSYLITGGAGFIGSAIARALVREGQQVRVIDNLASGKLANLADVAGQVEFIEASILDSAALSAAVKGVEVVYHEAAIPSVPRSVAAPLPSHEANATGTLAVLDAARLAGVRRVVYAGSSSAYGETPTLPKIETMPPSPLSPYAASKLAGEQYCKVYHHVYGLETVVLRYFNVFGPRQDPNSQYAAVIPKFVTAALRGESPVIYGDGTQSRDFCFIDNVVQANLVAADAPGASGGVFNIACGEAIDLNGVVREIGRLLGKAVTAQYSDKRSGDIKHSLASITAAKSVLGYKGEISFIEGLRRTIEWYRENA
jgi:nucleoside-diphosphate-sugar epimerase